jgi:hypothetical protein
MFFWNNYFVRSYAFFDFATALVKELLRLAALFL